METNNFTGVLPVYKPQGFTSFDVIAKLRGILKMRRIGHAGTLDPMATGVLPVLLGNAARACDIIPEDKKAYIAGFALGMTTDTQDITGKQLSSDPRGVPRGELETVLSGFAGEQKQLPPMYSAVTVNGKRLYELARQGIETQRAEKTIFVHEIKLDEYQPEERRGELSFTVSRGTYIRTLIHDMGQLLGCGAVMTSLVRTASAGITLDSCLTLDEISGLAANGALEGAIIPTERLFESLYRITLDDVQTPMYKNGVKLDLSRVADAPAESCRCAVYGTDGFIGTGFADTVGAELRSEKNFAARP